MMVSIHAAVGVSTSLLFYEQVDVGPNKIKPYILPLLLNVALHGIMDVMPHSHPIPPNFDIIIALLIPTLLIPFVKRKYWMLILICYLGSILPDVIDLGFFRVLGFGAFRIFPWHFVRVYNFLDAIYTSRLVNALFDALVIFACVFLVVWKSLKSKESPI